MKIYIDSANISEIEDAVSTGLVDGVTTNPSLVSKEHGDFHDILKKICQIFRKVKSDFTVSAEVTQTSSVDDMLKNARVLSKIDKNIVVKIPLTVDGLKVVKILEKEKIRCNVTLCFSANQALLAAKAGAYIVSPFIGRVEDQGWDGFDLVENIKTIYSNYDFKTNILAASVRSCEHVHDCAKIGVDIVTVPYSIFKKLYHNPLTDLGMSKFEDDWAKYKKENEKK